MAKEDSIFSIAAAPVPNHKTHGPLSDPFNPVIWNKSFSSLWNTNGYDPGSKYKWWSPWIMNIYKITSTEWIAFCHIEKSSNNSDGPTGKVVNFSAGIGYSNNGGESWTFCGETICLWQDPTGKNIGAAAVTIKKERGSDYFYVYYNDINSAGQKGMAVARAKVTDVIAAARNKSVSSWKKYYNGSWTEKWMGGSRDYSPDRHRYARRYTPQPRAWQVPVCRQFPERKEASTDRSL